MKKEQDTLPTNANGTDKQESNSTELFENIPIKDTPFNAVKVDEKWFLTLGKYRLTEPMKSYEEVLKDAQDASWFRIMQVINVMIHEHEKETQLEKEKRHHKENFSNDNELLNLK